MAHSMLELDEHEAQAELSIIQFVSMYSNYQNYILKFDWKLN